MLVGAALFALAVQKHCLRAAALPPLRLAVNQD